MFRLAAPHLFVDNLCVGAKRLRQGDGFTFAWVKFRQRRVWRYGDLPYLQPSWRACDPSSHDSGRFLRLQLADNCLRYDHATVEVLQNIACSRRIR